jgi:predicted small secreted protein
MRTVFTSIALAIANVCKTFHVSEIDMAMDDITSIAKQIFPQLNIHGSYMRYKDGVKINEGVLQ